MQGAQSLVAGAPAGEPGIDQQQPTDVGGFDPEEFIKQRKEETYGTPGQKLQTLAETFASGLTGFGIAEEIQKEAGVDPEAIRLRRETNPKTAAAGEIGGFIAGSFIGTGEAQAMKLAGEAALAARQGGRAIEGAGLAIKEAPSLLAKMGDSAAKWGAEMAVAGISDEAVKHALNEPVSMQTAVTDIGGSALLGAAVGAGGRAIGSGVISPLWKATAGPVVENTMGTVKQWLEQTRQPLSAEVRQAAETLGVDATEHFRFPTVDTDKTVRKTVSDTVMAAAGKSPEEFLAYDRSVMGRRAMETFDNTIKERLEPVQREFRALEKPFEAAKISDEEVGNLANKIITLGYDRKWIGKELAQNELLDAVLDRLPQIKTANDMKGLITTVGEIARKDPKVLTGPKYAIQDILMEAQQNAIGKAMLEKTPTLFDRYVQARKDYAGIMGTLRRVGDELSVSRFDSPNSFRKEVQRKLSPEQFLSRLSPKGNAEILGLLEQSFPETMNVIKDNELRNLVAPAVKAAKGEEMINVKTLLASIAKASAGEKARVEFALPKELLDKAQAAEKFLDAMPKVSAKTAMEHMVEKMAPSVLAAIAWTAGHNPIWGAVIGHLAAVMGSPEKAVKTAMMKVLSSDKPFVASAFKRTADIMESTIRSEGNINKAVKGIFQGTGRVIGESSFPTAADRAKLDKIVTTVTNAPETMLQVADASDDTGYYTPDHQTELMSTSVRVAQYLQQLKPHDTQLGPLDKPVPPSPAQTARYNRALDIAQQPMVVLQHIKDGTLLPTDIQDISGMYPALYTRFASKIANEMTTAASDDKLIPYRTRVAMSMFMGNAVDSTLTAQSIMAAQPAPSSPAAAPSPASQQKSAPKKGKSTQSLGKAAKDYMTPAQSAEQHRGKRE